MFYFVSLPVNVQKTSLHKTDIFLMTPE